MKSSEVFSKIAQEAGTSLVRMQRTEKSARTWFKREAEKITKISPNMILRDLKKEPTGATPIPGTMYLFRYDAKLKNELPYWDMYPLIFCVGPADGGFYGLNLHYLAPMQRAKLMDALYTLIMNTEYSPEYRLRISYDILKSASKFKYFKPCFKHYLSDHLRSRLLVIPSDDWNTAVFLPTARFQKASEHTVHMDSNRIIQKPTKKK